MNKVGVYFGRFLPCHRGHLSQIINAATQCEKLYVVVSDNKNTTKKQCEEAGIKPIPAELRIQWLSQETQDLDHIKVVLLDETNIPVYPNGWMEWANLMQEVVGEYINAFFCGEIEYKDNLLKYFPDAEVILFDPSRTQYPISATEIRQNPYKHWDYILGSARPHFAKSVLIVGTESCVDADTEYFNGVDWVKISDYKDGDKVLQFNEDMTASLVSPNSYIKAPCEEMIMFHNTYKTWSQVYSEDHDLVYLTSKGNLAKKTAKEVKQSLYENKYGFTGKFINWFNMDGKVSLDSNKLQLMLAISADGTLHGKSHWRIRVKKERKILKLRQLITDIGLELDERVYSDGYSNFFVPVEYGEKVLPDCFLDLDRASKEVVIENIFFWDGCEKNKRYFTTIKRNMDIVQFIFNSCGLKTLIHIDKREDKGICYAVELSSVKYSTLDCKPDTDRSRLVESYKTKDGFKYCFNVPSHMLVLRRDNYVFVTGNCGKTTLTKYLAKMYHTSWSEEVGRYYAQRFLGGNETIFTDKDFGRIAVQQSEQDYQALRNANKLCFFDTDATVTQYYSKLYMGHENPMVEMFIDASKYDLVLMLKPDVAWVDDGQRLNGDQEKRIALHQELKDMLSTRGFADKIVEIGGDYHARLGQALNEVDKLF